jgi:tRNA-dihydrouridine synthase
VLVGRGVLRNPWILAQAADIANGRPPRDVTMRERGQFLLDYIDLLVDEHVDEKDGFRHVVPEQGSGLRAQGSALPAERVARGRERWVINKLRALCAWYSKGIDCGSHLRIRVNSAQSISELRDIVDEFFFTSPEIAEASILV